MSYDIKLSNYINNISFLESKSDLAEINKNLHAGILLTLLLLVY